MHQMEGTLYQYKIVTLGIHDVGMWDFKGTREAEDELAAHGNNGWDLVSVVDNKAFLKRKIVVVDDK